MLILDNLAAEITEVVSLNVEMAIVIGGGNIFPWVWRPQTPGWNVLRLITWECWPPSLNALALTKLLFEAKEHFHPCPICHRNAPIG